MRLGSANSAGSDRSAISSGVLMAPPSALLNAAKKMSSWRHMTPFGMPVVPPV